MLVTRIIGSCPGCGRERSFSNVNIGNNMLLRGCLHCKYSEDLPLPDLDKKVLYLDQYFFSHAFRGGNDPRFRRAVDQIADLAHRQLLVSPYSDVHITESGLWTSDQSDDLAHGPGPDRLPPVLHQARMTC